MRRFKDPELHRKAAAKHYAKEQEIDKDISIGGKLQDVMGSRRDSLRDQAFGHNMKAREHEQAASALERAKVHLEKETERGEHRPAVGGFTDHKHGGES